MTQASSPDGVLTQQVGDLKRTLHLDSYMCKGPKTVITTDASPWGLGAVLEINGRLEAYFSSEVTMLDREILSLGTEPSSSDQQVLEALAMLVAGSEAELNVAIRLPWPVPSADGSAVGGAMDVELL